MPSSICSLMGPLSRIFHMALKSLHFDRDGVALLIHELSPSIWPRLILLKILVFYMITSTVQQHYTYSVTLSDPFNGFVSLFFWRHCLYFFGIFRVTFSSKYTPKLSFFLFVKWNFRCCIPVKFNF